MAVKELTYSQIKQSFEKSLDKKLGKNLQYYINYSYKGSIVITQNELNTFLSMNNANLDARDYFYEVLGTKDFRFDHTFVPISSTTNFPQQNTKPASQPAASFSNNSSDLFLNGSDMMTAPYIFSNENEYNSMSSKFTQTVQSLKNSLSSPRVGEEEFNKFVKKQQDRETIHVDTINKIFGANLSKKEYLDKMNIGLTSITSVSPTEVRNAIVEANATAIINENNEVFSYLDENGKEQILDADLIREAKAKDLEAKLKKNPKAIIGKTPQDYAVWNRAKNITKQKSSLQKVKAAVALADQEIADFLAGNLNFEELSIDTKQMIAAKKATNQYGTVALGANPIYATGFTQLVTKGSGDLFEVVSQYNLTNAIDQEFSNSKNIKTVTVMAGIKGGTGKSSKSKASDMTQLIKDFGLENISTQYAKGISKSTYKTVDMQQTYIYEEGGVQKSYTYTLDLKQSIKDEGSSKYSGRISGFKMKDLVSGDYHKVVKGKDLILSLNVELKTLLTIIASAYVIFGSSANEKLKEELVTLAFLAASSDKFLDHFIKVYTKSGNTDGAYKKAASGSLPIPIMLLINNNVWWFSDLLTSLNDVFFSGEKAVSLKFNSPITADFLEQEKQKIIPDQNTYLNNLNLLIGSLASNELTKAYKMIYDKLLSTTISLDLEFQMKK